MGSQPNREQCRSYTEKSSDSASGKTVSIQDQIIQTIVNVLQALVGFAMAIGEIAAGDPAGAAAAASAVNVATKATNVAGFFLKSDTIKAIKGGTEAVLKLYESTNAPKCDVTTAGGDVSDDNQSNVDLAAVYGLAAWDDWILQSDTQMAYAVQQSIGGAEAYRLELRRHSIDRRLLVQARAQAVKLGQEYIQLRLQLRAKKANKSRLQQPYDGYRESRKWPSRLKATSTTSVTTYTRDAVWAYKYYTLSDSSIVLDPLKNALQYQQDSRTILLCVMRIIRAILHVSMLRLKLGHPKLTLSFLSRSAFSLSIQTLEVTPLDYPTSVVTALKSSSHSVTITFSPSITATSTSSSLTSTVSRSMLPPVSGPFVYGSRFRVFGMRAFLLGAKPLPASFSPVTLKAPVLLTISTSGIYNDVQDNVVYGYTMKPLERTFKYLVARDGTVQQPYTFDSIIRMDSTAFAQWTVKIENANTLDLSGLTGLELYWVGNARLNRR
ncbi:putative sterigmatocystin biosynthesis P450 monooxygenase stcF protein [Rutstroemia sp. NJR-2017a BVV2]|nr:putative sterigmatocystin biosynthesis P450 monooxygenase stcF protein [Rutstroemia sp. NJR-2017a BVV2]